MLEHKSCLHKTLCTARNILNLQLYQSHSYGLFLVLWLKRITRRKKALVSPLRYFSLPQTKYFFFFNFFFPSLLFLFAVDQTKQIALFSFIWSAVVDVNINFPSPNTFLNVFLFLYTSITKILKYMRILHYFLGLVQNHLGPMFTWPLCLLGLGAQSG